jgi:lipoprotein-anchoring transpeptidase ErfK/SrfK
MMSGASVPIGARYSEREGIINWRFQRADMHIPLLLTILLPIAQDGTAPAQTDALQLQVMLDRAGFSPGVIDGRMGTNTTKALEQFRTQRKAIGTAGAETVTRYRITSEDAAGPFVDDIPADLVKQAALPSLGYKTVLEALAERFHSSPALLQRLNPGARFAADEEIVVPNVEAMIIPPPQPDTTKRSPADRRAENSAAAKAAAAKPDVIVTVATGTSSLTVTDSAGEVLMYAPVTTGSEHDPLPIGEWKVNGVQVNPTFRYNPDLFWDADPSHTKATIPAGPNNPVGLVWIDLSKEHYGLHGTAEPATIGRTESHGCVRLTNWDALRLANIVRPGTRVVFTD